MERGSLVGREGWGCKIPISVLLFTSLWNSVGILWQRTSGEQLNLAYPTPVLALKEQNKSTGWELPQLGLGLTLSIPLYMFDTGATWSMFLIPKSLIWKTRGVTLTTLPKEEEADGNRCGAALAMTWRESFSNLPTTQGSSHLAF